MDESVVAEAARSLSRLFDRISTLERRHELELELRFGTISTEGHFVPGVKREFLETAIDRLSTNAACEASDWVEHEDYFYNTTIDRQSCQVRTRVEYDPYELELRPTHVRKEKIDSVTMRAGAVAVRVALSRERPVAKSLVPTCVTPSRVSIKQRKRIRWTRKPASAPPWSYEFSLAWAAESRSKAEHARTIAGACTHELEIELDLTSDYTQRHASEYLATSLLMKALDLLEPGSILAPIPDRRDVMVR